MDPANALNKILWLFLGQCGL